MLEGCELSNEEVTSLGYSSMELPQANEGSIQRVEGNNENIDNVHDDIDVNGLLQHENAKFQVVPTMAVNNGQDFDPSHVRRHPQNSEIVGIPSTEFNTFTAQHGQRPQTQEHNRLSINSTINTKVQSPYYSKPTEELSVPATGNEVVVTSKHFNANRPVEETIEKKDGQMVYCLSSNTGKPIICISSLPPLSSLNAIDNYFTITHLANAKGQIHWVI